MQIVAQSLIFQKEGENHYYFYVNNSLDESFVANDSVASNLNRSCMNAFLQTLCHGENYYHRINFIKVAYTVDIFRLDQKPTSPFFPSRKTHIPCLFSLTTLQEENTYQNGKFILKGGSGLI